jgi:hypothetical protein
MRIHRSVLRLVVLATLAFANVALARADARSEGDWITDETDTPCTFCRPDCPSLLIEYCQAASCPSGYATGCSVYSCTSKDGRHNDYSIVCQGT